MYSNFIHNHQKWKHSQLSINSECTNSLWYIHTEEYYSSIKRIKYQYIQEYWGISKAIISSEGQTRKAANCLILFLGHSVKSKIIGFKSDQWLPEMGEWGKDWFQRSTGNFLGDGNILYLDCGDGYILYMFLKTYRTI